MTSGNGTRTGVDGFVELSQGDPAPWFHQRSPVNPRYALDTAAGRYLVLCFFGSADSPRAQAALKAVRAQPGLFNDEFAAFFGVSTDPADESLSRLQEHYPGYRYFWDFDFTISRLYGAASHQAPPSTVLPNYRYQWVVLDPALRVVTRLHMRDDGSEHSVVVDLLRGLPPPASHAGSETPAPVLLLPNVFERPLCQRLIDLYHVAQPEDSGFMREEAGLTVSAIDHAHKQRRDVNIDDGKLIALLKQRVVQRVVPEIRKAFQFQVTRMERYIVAAYSAEHGGHFQPHRDNTTRGTAHRRFALSVNLNEDYDGAELGFPEFGGRTYRTGVGGAIVFSCSLLHTVRPIRRGTRYVFLPFLYDDAAALIREQNNRFLGEGLQTYTARPNDHDSRPT